MADNAQQIKLINSVTSFLISIYFIQPLWTNLPFQIFTQMSQRYDIWKGSYLLMNKMHTSLYFITECIMYQTELYDNRTKRVTKRLSTCALYRRAPIHKWYYFCNNLCDLWIKLQSLQSAKLKIMNNKCMQ